MNFDLDYNSASQILKRINATFFANEYYIKPTIAHDYLTSFLRSEINSSNLEAIITKLDNFLNDENEDQASLLDYDAINNVLLSLENIYLAQNIGSNNFAPQAKGEFMGDSDNLVHTATVIIGTKEISNVVDGDDNTITAILGNTPLASFILLNNSYAATSTISDQLELYRISYSSAIGQGFNLNIVSSLELYSCESSAILGSLIYATSSQPSLTEGINGFFACATWASSPEYNGLIDLTHSTTCASSIDANLFGDCLNILSGANND